MTRLRLAALAVVVLAAGAVLDARQAAAPRAVTPPPAVAAGAPPLGADTPFQCWWRASSGAIRLGEVVDVALTCAVLESATVTAVPDESRLTVASVQLSPFEIVDGTHPPDVRDGDRRFFQYRYRLRIINPDVIGRDVKLPPLAIAYRLQSRMGGDATLAGRDLVHQMPQLIFRVVSQVPADADDIRDSADASLSEIEALRFRANAFSVAAMVFVALGAIAVLSTLVPVVGLLRRTRTRSVQRLSPRLVLNEAARTLSDRLDGARAAGWTAEALGEAHAAARIVAAIAAGTGARESQLARGATVPEGRLAVHGAFGRGGAAVTTHVTTDVLTQALAAWPAGRSASARGRVEQLRDALATLTRAQYSAAGTFDGAAIDEAVGRARDLGRELAREQWTSPREWFRRPIAPATPTPEF